MTCKAVNSDQGWEGDLDPPKPNQPPLEAGHPDSRSTSSAPAIGYWSLARLEEELLLVIEGRISVRHQGHLKWEECLENFVQRWGDGYSLPQMNRMNLKLSSLTNLDPE
ncbi:MAG TPA: hypothetical protein V6D11_05490 [Waterburya sp.]